MTQTELLPRDDKATAPAVVDEPASPTDMLAMIERMAINPNIDVEKLERLIAMKKDMDASAARIAFTQGMVKMRPDLPRIEKKGHTDKYAFGKWEDIQDLIDPVLQKHGFDLTFRTSSGDKGITITAVLSHQAGHEKETDLTLPADKGPGRNDNQAIGSTVSYGKRYTAGALLNLKLVGEDDDGAAGGRGNLLSMEQIEELENSIREVAKTDAEFEAWVKSLLDYLKHPSLDKIPAKDFAKTKAAIANAKRQRSQK